MESKISSNQIRRCSDKKFISEQEKACDSISSHPLFVSDTGDYEIKYLINEMERMQKENKLKAIFLDSLNGILQNKDRNNKKLL